MSDDNKNTKITEASSSSSSLNMDYEKMKNTDLYDACIERGIVFDPKTPRLALVDALRSHDAQEELKKLVKIKLHNQDSIGGSHPAQVGWNERKFVIPREIPVKVPLGVVKVLESCIEQKRETIGGRSVIRDYPRFSFSVIPE